MAGICAKSLLSYSVIAMISVTNSYAKNEGANKQYEIAQVNIDANATSAGLTSKTDKFQGVREISREMIEAMPGGNGDFVQLLRTNPSVQFSSTNRQSTTLGEISPANVSINGAKYWQNNFTVDGVNINNDLDPARNPGGNPGRYSAFDTSLNSVSQGMAIDSDFIESISVYDSDVSAKYGGFTGGVIDAKTRNPREGFHGKFSMQHTRDAWTKYHIYGNPEKFENSSNSQNQPRFEKWITRLNLEGFLRDDLGLMFGYTNTRSKIPLKAYDSRYNADTSITERVQRRNIDNYFLKALWYANDRLTLTPSITYAPEDSKIFNDHVKDSFVAMKSGGLNLALKADYEFDFMQLNQVLSYNRLQSSRDAENEYYRAWQYSNVKNWGSRIFSSAAIEGGYGDIEQTQKTLVYTADLKFNEAEILNTTHKFLAGVELKRQDARFSVKNEFMTAEGRQPLPGGVTACAPGDELCSIDNSFAHLGRAGQYLTSRTFYRGNTSVDMLSWALYFEDEMKIGNLTLRPGVRFGGDDYMDKKTLAPRFSSSYDFFGDESSVISFGANRYYGRNIFAYKLRDGRERLKYTQTRSRAVYNQNWSALTQDRSLTKFSQLDIPYDDELSYGAKQRLGNLEFFGKYVRRKGRDQIIKSNRRNLGLPPVPPSSPYQANYQTFTNDGKSDSKIFAFGVKTINDYEIWGVKNGFELNFEHLKTKTNNTLYDVSLDSSILNDTKMVEYKGRLIKYTDLPAQNFTRPWVASLNIITKIPSYGVSVNNYFSYKGSQEAIARTGMTPVGKYPLRYDMYEKVDLGNAYSWDMRIGYTKKLPKNAEFFANLDINNVLNKKSKASVLSDTSLDLIYEAGRQFWLEAGVKW